MTVTHRMSRTAEHNTWCEIRRRCENPKRNSYKYHGARGIKVCDRWQVFENFLADMGKRPSAAHSIERLDNDGDYEPGNCVWATAHEQGLNKRNNVIITAFGVTAPLGHFLPCPGGVPTNEYTRALRRLKRGWEAERALTASSDRRGGNQWRS
jgi:hypothetical protein